MLFETLQGGYVEIDVPITLALYPVFSDFLETNVKGESYVSYNNFYGYINFAYELEALSQNDNLDFLDTIRAKINQFDHSTSSVCESALNENLASTVVIAEILTRTSIPPLLPVQELFPASNQHQKFYSHCYPPLLGYAPPPCYSSPLGYEPPPGYGPPPSDPSPPGYYPPPIYYYAYRRQRRPQKQPPFSGRNRAAEAAQNREIKPRGL